MFEEAKRHMQMCIHENSHLSLSSPLFALLSPVLFIFCYINPHLKTLGYAEFEAKLRVIAEWCSVWLLHSIC